MDIQGRSRSGIEERIVLELDHRHLYCLERRLAILKDFPSYQGGLLAPFEPFGEGLLRRVACAAVYDDYRVVSPHESIIPSKQGVP